MNGGRTLIAPCEVAVKSVVPAVRALMTKELVEKYGLKQDQVAEILGISQSAVSKYTRQVRGYVIKIDNIDEVQPLIDEMIGMLVGGSCQRMELLRFFCRTCMAIRKTGLMCQFCQKTESRVEIRECSFCVTYSYVEER
jgi:predicted transcriptional regulator